jgi:hypothetical protein
MKLCRDHNEFTENVFVLDGKLYQRVELFNVILRQTAIRNEIFTQSKLKNKLPKFKKIAGDHWKPIEST